MLSRFFKKRRKKNREIVQVGPDEFAYSADDYTVSKGSWDGDMPAAKEKKGFFVCFAAPGEDDDLSLLVEDDSDSKVSLPEHEIELHSMSTDSSKSSSKASSEISVEMFCDNGLTV